MRGRGVSIWVLLLSVLLWVAPLHVGMAGGPKPGCAGTLCGRKFTPDRQFIPDRDLIWDWTRWSRSWGESVQGLGELTSDSPVVRALQWGAALPGVRDVLEGVGYAGEGLRGIYGEYFRAVTTGVTGTEGMGGLIPFEEFERAAGETGFVYGEMSAAGAAIGGAVVPAFVGGARTIGMGLGEMTGGMPGMVTPTGAVIPGVAAVPAYGGGAGMGAGAAIGFGAAVPGIQQAEMSYGRGRGMGHGEEHGFRPGKGAGSEKGFLKEVQRRFGLSKDDLRRVHDELSGIKSGGHAVPKEEFIELICALFPQKC